MFGHFYQRRDAELQRAKRSDAQLEYDKQLLADILNRAAALEALGNACFDLDLDARYHPDKPGVTAAAEEALRAFAVAAREFVDQDCSEARIRGRRARLFAGVEDDRVNAEVLETEESLQELGGALVPEYEEAAHA